MDFENLNQSAMRIRIQFARFEMLNTGLEWTRDEILQGFVVDVGDLVKLGVAKNGLRKVESVDEKIAHELCDCLWSVLGLAKLYGVNIETAFPKVMSDLDASISENFRQLSVSTQWPS